MLGEGAVSKIFTLNDLGWGAKQIARETGIARNTVRDWLRAGPDRVYGNGGRHPFLEKYYCWLQSRFNGGETNADVVRQELEANGVFVSLRTIQRALQPFRRSLELAKQATARFETPPGKQMQVDFGEKTLLIGEERQKRHVFVATLGYSRRCYIEVFGGLRQRDWIIGMEHAFHHFGGVPEVILCDNAKPLVLRRQGEKAIFHPEFEAFCRHWGVIPKACRPFRARTKGKVERGVGYTKGNALGRLGWASDEDLDGHLVWWMANVADIRIHGTTGERPIDRFPAEQAAMRPCGNQPSYLRVRRLTRTVDSDGRVEVDTNHYSVPPAFVGAKLDIVLEGDLLQILLHGRVLAEHAVHPGRYKVVEDPAHAVAYRKGTIQRQNPSEICRPIAHYAAIEGGEAW